MCWHVLIAEFGGATASPSRSADLECKAWETIGLMPDEGYRCTAVLEGDPDDDWAGCRRWGM